MRKHTYELGGRCVFCMKAFLPEHLTDEHIVPEAIHGTLVIKNGSCVPCARDSNSRYENLAINMDLQVPRLLLRLRGKGKAGLPKDIRHLPPVYAGDHTGGASGERLDFPVELYPRFFHLPKFPPPGLLVGEDRGADLTAIGLRYFNLGGGGLTNVTTVVGHINGPLAMMIAKIGYCYAVAEKGFDGFDGDQIRALLRGERADVYNFMGSTAQPERLSNRDLHGLYFRRRGEWLTVLVQLFASCAEKPQATFPYEIVVGTANGHSGR